MDIKLLHKFYNGKCSEEEEEQIISWFSSTEQKEKLLNKLQENWGDFDVTEDNVLEGYNSDMVLKAIYSRIRRENYSDGTDKKVRNLNKDQYYPLRVASIILFVFCFTFIFKFFQQDLSQNKPIAIHEVEVPRGQKKTIKLRDGTKVILNAGSRLSYPDQFSDNKREVTLRGEGFFEVTRDESRPFIVRSGEINTRVLGTSFNVRAYQEEPQIKIALVSGKVKVSRKEGSEYYLEPGKAANYNIAAGSFKVQDFDPNEALSWKSGILYFKDASFEEVKISLERWYGVKISTRGKSEQDWQYTGDFRRQNLESVLMSMSHVKHFSYRIKGDQVKIIFEKAK